MQARPVLAMFSSKVKSWGRSQTRCFSSIRELIVVRHGETEWNKALRVQGTTDIPLNVKGFVQAQACSESLKDELVPLIYSSPLSRASDTAWEIANTMNVQVKTHEALKEWNMGVLEGMRKDEASQHYPSDWKIFSQWANPRVSKHDSSTCITDGESMEEVRWRAVQFLQEVCQVDSEKVIICVTHDGILGQLLRHVADQGNLEEEYGRPNNACISRFAISSDTKQWKILSWADTSHLIGDTAPVEANYDDFTSENESSKASTR